MIILNYSRSNEPVVINRARLHGDATLRKYIVRGVNQSLVSINLIRVSGREAINPPHYHVTVEQGYT